MVRKHKIASSRHVIHDRSSYRLLENLLSSANPTVGGTSKQYYRILRVDRLEKRDLLAVLTAVVFEDSNASSQYEAGIDSPLAYHFVFVDQNNNQQFDDYEISAVSNEDGVVSIDVKDGLNVPLRAAETLLGGLMPSSSQSISFVGPKVSDLRSAPIQVVAFDTVLQGGPDGWVSVEQCSEGEGDGLDGNGDLEVIVSALPENTTTRTEIGRLLINGQAPPSQWTWIISDERFEISEGRLFVRAQTPLDFETEPEVKFTIEGVDPTGVPDANSGNRVATVSLMVQNENDPPTGLLLLGNSVMEKVDGAIVGPVRLMDQDANEPYEYIVSDPRFVVIGGMLRLRSGEYIERERESELELTVLARSLLKPEHEATASTRVEVLPNRHPWQNHASPLDVNNDGSANAMDALIIINHLNAHGSHPADGVAINSPSSGMPHFIDVNGDGYVGPIDALIIINQLNKNLNGNAEGSGRE